MYLVLLPTEDFPTLKRYDPLIHVSELTPNPPINSSEFVKRLAGIGGKCEYVDRRPFQFVAIDRNETLICILDAWSK